LGRPGRPDGRVLRGRYWHMKRWGHPRSNETGYVPCYILNAEKGPRKTAAARAEVHHAGSSLDDFNLVICQDRKYHKLLHVRMRIRDKGGNPNTDKICGLCQRAKHQGDFPKSRAVFDGLCGWCRGCVAIKGKGRYQRNLLRHAAA
jgi:hypothetical protein